MSSDAVRIVLVDDQALVRVGFTMVLDAEPDMSVVGEASDGLEGVELVCGRADVDVVLMDIRMPRLDGVAATERIMSRMGEKAPKVVVLTTFDLDEYVHAALHAGAAGFMLKDAGPTELLAAIRAVHRGDAVVAPSATRRLLERVVPTLPSTAPDEPSVLDVLTQREREVLVEVARGLSNSEIAAKLYLAEATVKTHIGRLLAKLSMRDRVQLVVLAYETGLVRAGSGRSD